jgi:hypothetical protein
MYSRARSVRLKAAEFGTEGLDVDEQEVATLQLKGSMTECYYGKLQENTSRAGDCGA